MKIKFIFTFFVFFFISCGGDSSSDSLSPEEPFSEDSSSETLFSSSKESSSSTTKNKPLSSSIKINSSSSLEKESSSSMTKGKSSSSSVKNESSSSKLDFSSSSLETENSSSEPKENSSSSSTNSSSSSEKPDSSSSSSIKGNTPDSSESKSSSSEYSSSSELENGSSSSEESSSSGFVGCIMGSLYDDRDGKTYKTVKIGEQEWMAENLNYDVQNYESSYRSWCYDGEVDNCQKYGRLYRWSVVIDSLTLANDSAITCGCRKSGEGICTIPYKWKGICPNGWHIPTQNEWGDLVKFVGGSDIAGKKLKSSEGWVSLGGINGTDEFCFAGSPAGYRSGSASYSNDYMYFWTADQYESGSTNAYAMYGFYKSNIFYSCYESTCVKAFPIRCIKD